MEGQEVGADLQLTALDVTGGTEEECSSAFKYYYKGNPAHVFCGRMTEGKIGFYSSIEAIWI